MINSVSNLEWSRDARAYTALSAVCILWGTTYLAIRISIEAFPPFYLIAIRYVISGSILLIAARLSGAYIPGRREFIQTGICGAVCIGIGNGFLAKAEQFVPSGLAALFYATCPFWMIGVDALLPGGKRPRASTVKGIAVGIAGVSVLVLPAAWHEGLHGGTTSGFVMMQISAIGWVTGALLQKKVQTRAKPMVSGAVQQLAAGLVMFVPALLFERMPESIPVGPALSFAYLVVFGSLIGFSAFIYSMAHLPVAIVSVYTFVNPIVAVLLGCLLAKEPFGFSDVLAMLIIFAGIVVVKRSESSEERARANRQLSAGEIETIGPEP